MAKVVKNNPIVSVEKVKPVAKVATEKPKSMMFICGPLQIPAEVKFTDKEFIAAFTGKKLGGRDINDVLEEYKDWKKNQ